MRNVYLCEPNCVVHKNGEYLTVRKSGSKISDISLNGVQNLLIFGNTQVTTQAMSSLLEKGIDIIYLTMGGRIKGRLKSESRRSVIMRIAQYDYWFDEDRRLAVAKEIVRRKLENQIEVVRRYRYRNENPALEEAEKSIQLSADMTAHAKTLESLLGDEGRAAAAYFNIFPIMIPEYEFEKRVRRPAYDPVNALLNLTYAFLKNEITSIAYSYSFDIQLGFLHNVRNGRDSLALDLMEIFRPIFADRFVVSLLNRRVIGRQDFEMTEEGLRLTPEALRRYCVMFQEHLYEENYESKKWKQVMEEEVLSFRRKLMNENKNDVLTDGTDENMALFQNDDGRLE